MIQATLELGKAMRFMTRQSAYGALERCHSRTWRDAHIEPFEEVEGFYIRLNHPAAPVGMFLADYTV